MNNNISKMNEVKQISLLPVLNVATISMAAEYFEIPTNAMSNYCANHRSELTECGMYKLHYSDLLNAGYEFVGGARNKVFKYGDMKFTLNSSGLRCLTEEAMFRIAMGIANSTIAAQIREKMSEEECAQDSFETKTISEIQTFTNAEFGSVRTVLINGEPWFISKDISDVLGYTNSRKSLKDHVDEDDRGVTNCYTPGGKQKVTIINESGLYSLIMSSKLASAKKFKRWITTEVLPSIRKHGAYMTPETLEKAIMNPDFLIELANRLKEEQEKNIALSEANAELSTANKALAKEANTWEKNSVLTALLRSYAVNCCGGKFGIAYDYFYKQLAYKHHINLKIRKTKSKDVRDIPLIKYLREGELEKAIQLAAAICEEKGINVGKVINDVNLSVCVG